MPDSSPALHSCNELIIAVKKKDIPTIQALLADGIEDINGRGTMHSSNALIEAAELGQTEIVRLLLDSGADINSRENVSSSTALVLAAKGNHLETVELLLSRNAETENRNNAGYTGLYWAAQMGHAQMIRLLADHNADVDAFNNEGLTPLMIAVINTKEEASLTLMDLGADVHMVDNKQRKVTDMPQLEKMPVVVDRIKNIDTYRAQEKIAQETTIAMATVEEVIAETQELLKAASPKPIKIRFKP